MDKESMVAAVNALKLGDKLPTMIAGMQAHHEGDHLTPTHTAPGGAGAQVKSFFMKSVQVAEQQGYTGASGWAGPKKRYVNVPGYEPIDDTGEAAIIKLALKQTEYMLLSDDDRFGPLFLFVTGTPSPYAGFDYLIGAALPMKVPLTAIAIRPEPHAKLSSVYPTSMDYVERKGGTIYTIA